MTKFTDPTKVITGPETRWSYLNAWEPKAIEGGTPKYSVSLIISKDDRKTVEKIMAAIKAAYAEGMAKLKGNGKSVPPLEAIKTPLRDGDKERPDDPAYANAWFINANSATAPGVVDASCQRIIDRSELYSGVYGRVCVNFFPYSFSGKKGIGCGLGPVQKLRDGEPLSGGTTAAQAFGAPRPSNPAPTGGINPITGQPM